ncbi:Peroxin-3 [Flagelloscypha sp. PMI_526]|nr:Peroxin-3 [Flagelloscypha sp. PMI_526]
MLRAVKRRKVGLAKAAGILSTVYCIHSYISSRLQEVKHSLESQRTASCRSSSSLKRRYTQNQQDILYTVMALLPSLSDQILSNMDVDLLTSQLKSVASSMELAGDVNSDVASSAMSSVATPDSFAPTDLSTSGLQSWVDASTSTSALHSSHLNNESAPESLSSSSEISATSSMLGTKTKVELWTELKLLTITRTLTTIYATSIFSLLTTIQLTLLARMKYVAAVRQAERDERVQEQLQSHFEISDQVESKFLTMKRVRRGVEDVFEGVSLKTRLAAIDIHRLVHDVRRRVEHEITFEGRERHTDLFSTVLPPTRETMQHVLKNSGFSSSSSSSGANLSQSSLLLSGPIEEDSVFDELFAEAKQWITSADFTIVLDACLDRACERFFADMEQDVFGGSETDVQAMGSGDLNRIRLAALAALNGLPNVLVDAVLDVPQVSIFQAIIWGKIDEVV